MKAWKAALVLPLATAGTMLVTSEPAHADDRVCRGTMGSGYVDGNVIVPRGATCTMLGTRVDGNVQVAAGALLHAAKVRVGGDIQAENARRVAVIGKDGVRARVSGNIQFDGTREGGRIKWVNTGGDIQLFSNRGRFEVRGNRVDGNLQCKGNVPRPVGGGNRVEGNKEDQCRGL